MGHGKLNIVSGVKSAKTKSQTAPRCVLGQADRLQHMAWFWIGRSAGAARRYGDLADVHHQRFAVDAGQRNVQIAGKSQRRRAERAVEGHPLDRRLQPDQQLIAERRLPGNFGRDFGQTKLQGAGHADDAGDI
ncbi:hypothetical protein DSM3645_03733 [Blastopirellula marina DSM 3645]|uniref:Uncharacterized protein n=1 Tax=Blastopirellula marina DSM 3645 TaxID=314230 RepID=A3ZW58_9BACT|nr:hypothetical protein DSM3645_03733 [Blastopirellula marina DSM 3645]